MVNQAQSLRTNLQKKYIREISIKLQDANIPHVFLKGSVLSNTIYPTGTRASNDIDLLISKKSIKKIKSVLSELGFLQGKYDYNKNIIKEFNQNTTKKFKNTLGEMAPFVKVVDEITTKTIDIDVNLSLDWAPDRSDGALDYFLEERVLILGNKNFSIYSLRKEHLFIHLCSHLYKDSSLVDLVKKRKVLDLYKFIDIYSFINKHFEQINTEKIFKDSVKYGFDKHVFFTLNYTIKIFPEIKNLGNVMTLFEKFSYIDDNIMTVIFDQYNPKNKMKGTDDLIERLFSYDIIQNYT